MQGCGARRYRRLLPICSSHRSVQQISLGLLHLARLSPWAYLTDPPPDDDSSEALAFGAGGFFFI